LNQFEISTTNVAPRVRIRSRPEILVRSIARQSCSLFIMAALRFHFRRRYHRRGSPKADTPLQRLRVPVRLRSGHHRPEPAQNRRRGRLSRSVCSGENARCHADMPCECDAERAGGSVTDPCCDLDQRRLLPNQKVFCKRHAPARHVFHRRDAHLPSEAVEECRPRHCGGLCQFLDGHACARVLMNASQRWSQADVGKPRNNPGDVSAPPVLRRASMKRTSSNRLRIMSRAASLPIISA